MVTHLHNHPSAWSPVKDELGLCMLQFDWALQRIITRHLTTQWTCIDSRNFETLHNSKVI